MINPLCTTVEELSALLLFKPASDKLKPSFPMFLFPPDLITDYYKGPGTTSTGTTTSLAEIVPLVVRSSSYDKYSDDDNPSQTSSCSHKFDHQLD